MPAVDPILFFGTPDFAVPTLAALVAAGRAPALVVTQPPRPAGRGRQPQEPPVALLARRHGLPVAQPERVRDPAFLETVRELDPRPPGIAVVVAFGQIFPRELLALPRHGCINLHASLLPRWRGAAPIQAAIAAGDRATGVTTMRMEAGLDTGPVLLQEAVEIAPGETAGELSQRLAERGAALVVRTLERLEAGDLEPRPQDGAAATYAPRLTRDSGRFDAALTAGELAARLRAFTPWPGLTAELRGGPLKLLAAVPLPETTETAEAAGEPPGTLLGLRPEGLAVACGDGSVLAVSALQRPGRKPQRAADFVNGERLRPGERLT